MKTVIFDLDGTLADTSVDLIAAANAAFRTMGEGNLLDPTKDAVTAFQGGRAMLRLGLTRLERMNEAVVDEFYPVLLEAYSGAIDVHTQLYPRAMEAVEVLKAEGYGVGICTNKPEALAELLMTRLGARAAFGALIGADSLPVRKPDPAPLIETVRRLGGDPAQTVLIGDTVTDRDTARAAGVPSILVTFGPGGKEVAALEPEALLNDYADLPDLLRDLARRRMGIVDQRR
ncbi:HAD-IA family hydrolase [Salinihabitans flavidus]|uniref:HAD-IA family hydrolase n=1 Tax=Salinihabitans flavidus TaxID=569882 RepID=UPI000B87161F|nr:HAD-IA family hydrolase [Salinihabitans flavidus]